jgi:aspartyl-tRNA(Asn)/glutamyl-tRNA(Gln) amidotransferase subunit C
MTLFSEDFIDELAQRCMIELNQDEKQHIRHDLEQVFKHIESLNEINTDNTSPCTHGHHFLENVVREDLVKNCLDRETFLNNSPAHIAGMIRVPTIINKEGS